MKPYDGLIKSYARQAEKYDRRWAHYNQETVRATLEAVPWDSLKRILDVSCGTGLFEEAARRLHPETQIIGVDISAAMLAQARQKLRGDEPVALVHAAAEALPFADGNFDAVVCANSFHYYRSPTQVVNELHRVLRPGGWLVVVDWCDDYLFCKVCDWILGLVDRAHFRMYGMRQCRELLTQAGFRVEMESRFKIDWFWGLMTHRAQAPGRD